MRKLFLLFIGFIIFLIPGSLALAKNSDAEVRNVVVQKNEVINHDYFAAGNSVSISGTVNGDVYVAGSSITVDGVVNGDLIAAGGTINVSGEVKNNLRVAGGNVTVSGKVANNILVGSGNLVISKESQIGGSLIAGAGTIDINAPLHKTIWLGSGQVRVNAPVTGDINAGVSDLTLGSEAKVSGNLTYWSDNQAKLLDGASVSGQLKREIIQKPQASRYFGVISAFGITIKIIKLVSLLILGLLLLKFLPKKTLAISNRLTVNWLGNLGWGLGTVVVTGFLGVVLILSLVGFPLGFLLFFILGMGLYLSEIFISLWLGRKLFVGLDQGNRYGWAMIVGLVVYEALTLVPIFGWLLRLVATLISFGALVQVKKETYQELKNQL